MCTEPVNIIYISSFIVSQFKTDTFFRIILYSVILLERNETYKFTIDYLKANKPMILIKSIKLLTL
jgi:hypothetical protein